MAGPRRDGRGLGRCRDRPRAGSRARTRPGGAATHRAARRGRRSGRHGTTAVQEGRSPGGNSGRPPEAPARPAAAPRTSLARSAGPLRPGRRVAGQVRADAQWEGPARRDGPPSDRLLRPGGGRRRRADDERLRHPGVGTPPAHHRVPWRSWKADPGSGAALIVLHGWWSIERDPRGELILWAEDSEAPPQPPVRRGRRPARQTHPFAVSAQALAAATAAEGTPSTAVLALPNQGRGPSASAEVRRTRAESQTSESPAVGQWEVPTLVGMTS